MRILLIVLLLFQFALFGCGRADQVAITGKTVYQGMAIEEVQVRVLRLDGTLWKESASSRSGYHGSFHVRTEPGMIRLEAKGEIMAWGRRIPLEGRVDNLAISPGVRRVERIVIELDRVNRFP